MRRGRYRTLGATRRGAQRQGTSLFGQARWKPIAVLAIFIVLYFTISFSSSRRQTDAIAYASGTTVPGAEEEEEKEEERDSATPSAGQHLPPPLEEVEAERESLPSSEENAGEGETEEEGVADRTSPPSPPPDDASDAEVEENNSEHSQAPVADSEELGKNTTTTLDSSNVAAKNESDASSLEGKEGEIEQQPSPPPAPSPPPPPSACARRSPCAINAVCQASKVDPEQKFRCLCKKGHKGNAYSNGKDRCKTKEEAYLQKLYGYDKCDGCKFVRAMKAVFKSTKDLRVLDLGTGSCDALRNMLKMGMNATGVESAILSLEDNCPDLLESGAAITTKFDELPFQNSTFDVVFVSHVLEFVPKDSLDDVIAEIARVTKLHVFLALQTPGEGKRSHGKVVDGLELETYYSNIWWRERFAAHGLDLFDIQTHMILERARRKSIKLESSEVAMMLGKAPQADSREFPLIHKVYCLACNYMPLISYMYSPPVVVSQSQYRKKLTMGYTMVLGPSSCNVMRGLLENPPSSMKKAVALQPVPYTVSRDCPDLSNQRLVLEMPPDATRLPFKRHKADLVLSLFHLELMTEGEIKFHLEELKRVTNHRVLFLIHTCGSDFASETCLANAIPGIVTVKPRAWWSDLLVSHGFEAEEISHALQKRQCRAEETKENATASRMGYCDSILEELSAKSTYELTLQDVFPMFVKAAHPEEQGDLGDLIEQHKAKENGEGEDEDSFVDLKSFKENSELDAFEYELALTGTKDRHRSKRYKEEQKIMAKLRKMFPDTPPAPRTAHIYKSRGYNVRSARTQIPHDDEEEGGGRRRL